MSDAQDLAGRLPDPDPTGGGRTGWYDRGPVPAQLRHGPFLFVPLTAALVAEDYAAVMSTAARLRWWSESAWPSADFSLGENERDLVWHDDEHQRRVAFTYSVLDAEAEDAGQTLVIGCIYIRPFAAAFATRGIECPADLREAGDAVVRGWLIDDWDDRRPEFIDVVLSWLRSPAWSFPAAWWQARVDPAETLRPADRHVGGWSFTPFAG